MDATVPAGAALLLDFIAGYESAGRYDVIYGHHEKEPEDVDHLDDARRGCCPGTGDARQQDGAPIITFTAN